jgi:hypothetical protein
LQEMASTRERSRSREAECSGGKKCQLRCLCSSLCHGVVGSAKGTLLYGVKEPNALCASCGKVFGECVSVPFHPVRGPGEVRTSYVSLPSPPSPAHPSLSASPARTLHPLLTVRAICVYVRLLFTLPTLLGRLTTSTTIQRVHCKAH